MERVVEGARATAVSGPAPFGSAHRSAGPHGGAGGPARGGSDAGAGDAELALELADLTIRRLFEVGLLLASASDLAGPAAGSRLRRAIAEIDGLVDELRAACFGPALDAGGTTSTP